MLHAFTAERRAALKIAPGTPFFEESTFWNPSWTITHGAIQTTNITDLAATAAGIGSGKLLSPESYKAMVSTDLRGRTHPQPGCTTCAELNDIYTYGLGIVISGEWLLQNPMFFGYAAVEAYLPSQRIAIATAVTFDRGAFDGQGNYSNAADTLFREIAPHWPPTTPRPLRRPAEDRPRVGLLHENASRTVHTPTLDASNVSTVPKVLFIYNDPSAPEALLGEVFTEQGFDIDIFNVVPAGRVADPAVDVVFPDPTRYDVVVPLGSRWSVHDDALRKHLGRRRDADGA